MLLIRTEKNYITVSADLGQREVEGVRVREKCLV